MNHGTACRGEVYIRGREEEEEEEEEMLLSFSQTLMCPTPLTLQIKANVSSLLNNVDNACLPFHTGPECH